MYDAINVLLRILRKKLLRTIKNKYFNNLSPKNVNSNRTLWGTVVPLFQTKVQEVINLS